MREKLLQAIAVLDVLDRVDIRELGDDELLEYKAALLRCRDLLLEMLRRIDSAEMN